MATENQDIKLIKPPTLLMLLPLATGIMGVWYGRKKENLSWFSSLLIGGGAMILGSVPSIFWANQINEQYIEQNEEKV